MNKDYLRIVENYLRIIEREHNSTSSPESLIYSEELERMEEIKVAATERAYNAGILKADPIQINLMRSCSINDTKFATSKHWGHK